MKLPPKPPSLSELGAGGLEKILALNSSAIDNLPKNKYLHWSKLRYLEPPSGFSNEDWWLAIKLARASNRHPLPLDDKQGRAFSYTDSGYLYRMLHEVDRDAGGRIELPADVVNAGSRNRYLVSSLIEEAITSSQLEGASTTRRAAKEMLRSGRPPRDRSETMIANNYRGMEFVREHVDERLSVPMLLELQRILTEGTQDDAGVVGRFRLKSDHVVIMDRHDGTIVHTPPDADELDARMERLLAFANASDDVGFAHPVLRAILLHFMIGYEHPFVDGNGRTARALFYWMMAKPGYWMTEFLSISTIIRKSPGQYARAYLFSETDDNDVTYFLDYNLRVILQSLRSLHSYLARKAREMRNVQHLLDGSAPAAMLNHRQIALLISMRKNPDFVYTIASHRRSHKVTYQTARTDQLGLADLGLVTVAKHGKTFVFSLARDFDERLRELSAAGNRGSGGHATTFPAARTSIRGLRRAIEADCVSCPQLG